MSRQFLFTSESVSEGHPDKIADILSDTILDLFLARDPQAKVACESFITRDLVLIAGEFRTTPPSLIDEITAQIPDQVRRTLQEIGYGADFPGIDPNGCEIRLVVNRQSEHIHQGVERADGVLGAGDQGLMFGYAVDETPELMPLPLTLAHRLVEKQAAVRCSGTLPWLRPDAKSQVTVRYEGTRPVGVERVVFSTQHAPNISQKTLIEAVQGKIIDPVIPLELRTAAFSVLINPTGRFEIGGPEGDTGLTGRKIIVDTYGGSCPHGGGAFSGKDPTKVDRSAAYMARYLAKQLVAAGLARRCTLQLAYAIGIAEPVSVFVDFHGTGTINEIQAEEAIQALFDLTPGGIIETLQLRRPVFRKTAAYGHFGRPGFSWEATDRVDDLRAYCR